MFKSALDLNERREMASDGKSEVAGEGREVAAVRKKKEETARERRESIVVMTLVVCIVGGKWTP